MTAATTTPTPPRPAATTAVLRYVFADLLRSQRWVAPLLFGAAAIVLFNSHSDPLLVIYGNTAVALLPIGIWMTYVAVTAEDAVQAGMTAVIVGGPGRLRMAKLVAAFLLGIGYAVVATITPLVVQDHTDAATPGKIVAGLVAATTITLFAVAVGAVVSPPVVRRRGWSVMIAAAVIVLDAAVPHAPPARAMLEVFDPDHPHHVAAGLAVTAIATLALSIVAIAVSTRVASRRG
jgi:hypothetical protein